MSVAAAFGFRWLGIEGASPAGAEVERWPAVEVRRGAGARACDADAVGPEAARLTAAGGSIALRRHPREATLELPGPVEDADVLRLHVARMAGVFGAWEGRIAFQAGAVVGEGRAVAVAGPARAGKTTLLDAFVRAGGELLCDELVSLDGGRALAGTPLLCLRPDALAAVGAPGPGRAAPPRASAPLAAFVLLEWGERPELVPLRPAERLAALAAARIAGASAELPPAVLDLARLPAWRLVRPRSWGALEAAAGLLFEALARTR